MCSLGEVCTPRSLLLFYYSTLGAFCQEFFLKFFNFFLTALCSLFLNSCSVSPWCIISISHLKEKVNSYLVKSCTNYGIKIGENLCNFSLDKIAEVWYNGNFGLRLRLRPTELVLTNSHQKKEGGFLRHLFSYVIQSSPSSNHLTTCQGRQVHSQPFSTRP